LETADILVGAGEATYTAPVVGESGGIDIAVGYDDRLDATIIAIGASRLGDGGSTESYLLRVVEHEVLDEVLVVGNLAAEVVIAIIGNDESVGAWVKGISDLEIIELGESRPSSSASGIGDLLLPREVEVARIASDIDCYHAVTLIAGARRHLNILVGELEGVDGERLAYGATIGRVEVGYGDGVVTGRDTNPAESRVVVIGIDSVARGIVLHPAELDRLLGISVGTCSANSLVLRALNISVA